MSRLAIDGGQPCVRGPLFKYNSIGELEENIVAQVVAGWPLSGFLGGQPRGGYWVTRLEDKWAERFKVKHAIACNSATSGLLAAAHAVGLGRGDRFIVSPFTMSATAAAPAMTGAKPWFCDVSPRTFSINMTATNAPGPPSSPLCKAVFLTHLFGLAVNELQWKEWCDRHELKLVVDAAQAPFANDDGVLAGTTGHIGVYSLNVHKHIQCGEGGIVVTNDDHLAEGVRRFVNHGEIAGGPLGLNLRMTELAAAVAVVQLRRANELIQDRTDQAEHLLQAIGDVPGLTAPFVPSACRHVYYTVPFTYAGDRTWFVRALQAEGVPLIEGYVRPLYWLPAFVRDSARAARPTCPMAERLHNETLFYFENCAWSPTPEQIEQIGDAFKKVAEHADRRTLDRV